MIKKVGILTAGGDCPGLNAVVRGIVKTAEYNGIETYGFLEGYKGLLENRLIKLDSYVTSGILRKVLYLILLLSFYQKPLYSRPNPSNNELEVYC